MRVGIDVRALTDRRTGLGWYTYYITDYLLKQRPEHEFVLLADGRFPEQQQWRGQCEVRTAGGLFHRTALRAYWDDWYYHRLLAKSRCQIALSPITAVPRTTRVPCVATVHDLAFLRYKHILPARYRRYWVRTVRNAVSRSAMLIAVSNATKRDLMFYCGAEDKRIEVVHEGVDPFFRERVTSDEAEEVLERHGLEPGYLLFVGTNEPRKNLSLVLDAFALLEPEIQANHPLVIAGGAGWGSGQWKSKMKRVSSYLYRLGHVDRVDLRVLYRHAGAFLFPSLYEGFGLPILEAMANGTPVITCRVSSMPEIAEGAADYVESDSPRSLAAAVERILTDTNRRQVLVSEGYKQVEKFSWDMAARKTWMVLDRVANGYHLLK